MARKSSRTPATTTVAPAAQVGQTPTTVALRGGKAVAQVTVNPAVTYHSKAPHNVAWWQAITSAAAAGPTPVAPMLVSANNPNGVPAHFVGYCLRRGYLLQVD
jgi:hypothetical protein